MVADSYAQEFNKALAQVRKGLEGYKCVCPNRTNHCSTRFDTKSHIYNIIVIYRSIIQSIYSLPGGSFVLYISAQWPFVMFFGVSSHMLLFRTFYVNSSIRAEIPLGSKPRSVWTRTVPSLKSEKLGKNRGAIRRNFPQFSRNSTQLWKSAPFRPIPPHYGLRQVSGKGIVFRALFSASSTFLEFERKSAYSSTMFS